MNIRLFNAHWKVIKGWLTVMTTIKDFDENLIKKLRLKDESMMKA